MYTYVCIHMCIQYNPDVKSHDIGANSHIENFKLHDIGANSHIDNFSYIIILLERIVQILLHISKYMCVNKSK